MGLKMEERERVRQFLIDNLDANPRDIARITGERFTISKQAVHRYLRNLVSEGVVKSEGAGRNTAYSLVRSEVYFDIEMVPNIAEDRVWREKVLPILPELRPNVLDICHYGFTEMFNNVIDHSGSKWAHVGIVWDAAKIELWLIDDGIGIFRKIKEHFGLEDARHAIFELAKGKLTSDPANHTGEGIFFTSRMFDDFYISSDNLRFMSESAAKDLLIETEEREQGTAVCMEIRRDSARTKKNVFDEYTERDEDFGFSKTVIPVKLLQYEGESLVSRSQAKRLIARFERFKEVILDFKGVVTIGPAFADEVFRVFKNAHPDVNLIYANASDDVGRSIKRALLAGSNLET